MGNTRAGIDPYLNLSFEEPFGFVVGRGVFCVESNVRDNAFLGDIVGSNLEDIANLRG